MLDVAGVDVDAALDEEAHEVGALDGVDEARAAKVVRLLHVGAGAHQAPDQSCPRIRLQIKVKRSMDLLDPLSDILIRSKLKEPGILDIIPMPNPWTISFKHHMS